MLDQNTSCVWSTADSCSSVTEIYVSCINTQCSVLSTLVWYLVARFSDHVWRSTMKS